MSKIPVDLYKTIKYLENKPSSFKEFCEEISKLFNIDGNSFAYEYLTRDKEYHVLDVFNYPNFYTEEYIIKIFAYSMPNEAYSFAENPEEQNINNYSNNLNNISNNNMDKIKLKIINAQKEKIRQSKILNYQREKENENEENKEKKIEINSIKKIEIVEKEDDENNDLSNQLNDIINKNFDKLKNDLINESSIQLSQIVMESKLNNIEKEKDDGVRTPSSVEMHTGISCSGCGANTIEGIRYKCVYCKDFDYCEECEEKKGYIHAHPLYKLRFKIN